MKQASSSHGARAAGPGTVLVLVAHGSRDPAWARPFEDLARETGARLAFLELGEPRLAAAVTQALAEGAPRVRVLPLFMAPGAHVREDIPAALDALRAAHPDRVIELLPSLGEDGRFWAALAELVRAHMPG